jgi:molecular chaperone GrpE
MSDMTDRKNPTDDGKRKGARRIPVDKGEPKAAPEADEQAEAAAQAKAGEQAADAPQDAAQDAPIPMPDIKAVGGDYAKVCAERDSYVDHLQRLKAEFDNYRKRVQRDEEQLRLRAAEAVVESLLPVMDNMARALEAAARHEEGQLIAGLELVAGQLRATLEGHGLQEVAVEPGELFDPNIHEAIMAQPSEEHEEGTVTQVLERGYLLHGRLLRPAKVIVAS